MKNTNRYWILVLGLATSLALPGLANADDWRQAPQKFAGQYDQQHYDRRGRDDADGYLARRAEHERHEWREHQRYRGDGDDDYRWHEWREHQRYRRYGDDDYRWHEWREHAPRYYGYRVYPGAYWSGFIAPPSVGLLIQLH